MYIAVAVFLLIFNIVALDDYAVYCANFNLRGLKGIQIEKEQNQSNREFLTDLETITRNLNCDISHMRMDYENETVTYLLYKTNHTDDFYDIPVEGNTQILHENECLSTINSYGNYRVRKIIGLFKENQYVIMNFDLIETYSLNNAVYYVKGNRLQDIVDTLEQNGYKVSPYDSSISVQEISFLDYLFYAIIPFSLMIVCCVFYFLFNGKANVLKKLEGYTNFDIRKEEWVANIKIFSLIFICVEIIIHIYVCFKAGNAVFLFFLHIKNKLFFAFILTILTFILCSRIICFQKSAEYIKGKSHNKLSFFVLLLFKTVFSVYVIINLSMAIHFAEMNYNMYQSHKNIADNTKDYYSFIFSSQSGDWFSTEGHEKAIHNCRKLYTDTVDRFDGIILSTHNYSVGTARNGKSVAESCQQRYITVNENYLKLYPLR